MWYLILWVHFFQPYTKEVGSYVLFGRSWNACLRIVWIFGFCSCHMRTGYLLPYKEFSPVFWCLISGLLCPRGKIEVYNLLNVQQNYYRNLLWNTFCLWSILVLPHGISPWVGFYFLLLTNPWTSAPRRMWQFLNPTYFIDGESMMDLYPIHSLASDVIRSLKPFVRFHPVLHHSNTFVLNNRFTVKLNPRVAVDNKNEKIFCIRKINCILHRHTK